MKPETFSAPCRHWAEGQESWLSVACFSRGFPSELGVETDFVGRLYSGHRPTPLKRVHSTDGKKNTLKLPNKLGNTWQNL